MPKLNLIAITYNDNEEVVGVARVCNVDDNELKHIVRKKREYEKAKNKEFFDLAHKVDELTKEIKELKHEIKVLKGEE